MNIVRITICFFLVISTCKNIQAQASIIELSKGKRKVWIKGGFIGLKTNDTDIAYNRDKKSDATIQTITDSSIIISSPTSTHDSLIPRGKFSTIPFIPANGRYIKNIRKDGRRMALINVIDKEEVKEYMYVDILAFQYPPRASESTGCIFCVLFPPYWFHFRRRWVPRTFYLKQWNFKVASSEILRLPLHDRKKL